MTKQLLLGLTISLLIIMTLLPRVGQLDRFLTADEKRWQANVSGFVTKLAYGKLDQLVQQPHPGITTQWLAAPTTFSQSWAVRKLPLVLAQAILVLLIGYVCWRLWGRWTAILATVLLSLSPPLIAHTRVLAMDSLLALFAVLSLGLLLLWRQQKNPHYLILAGASAAAAWLSKLPGITLVPFSLALLVYWHLWPQANWSKLAKNSVLWLVSFILGSALILPSLALTPVSVLGDFAELFRSDDYQSLHPASTFYYFSTVLFSSTPLNILGLMGMIAGLTFWRWPPEKRGQVFVLLLFATLFVVQMSLGAKKGDRYILPSLVLFDIITAVSLVGLATYWWQRANYRFSKIIVVLIMIGLVWQTAILWQLHPYTLAYVNPLFKPVLGERRLGWGEGLDLAAEYLNTKPEATKLKVASFYPNEFAYRFQGEVIPIHQWDTGSPNYVVTYRAMYERGAGAWETDVLQQLAAHTPEKIIKLGGIDYIWIYNFQLSELNRQ